MKLISCYIENYGTISKKEYSFSDGLTVFNEPNGKGKSTLASFIKAMFYGLPAYRANSKDFEDRQHFYPFNGGKFGGNLTFERKGETYRIERFFDEKSGKGDTLTVYKGAKITLELGADIGRTVFGIDEDAFGRSAFMGDEERAGAGLDINAKLNKYVYDEDAESTEDALKKLDERCRELKAKKGKGGYIDRLKEKRIAVEDEIKRLERLGETLEGQYADRKVIISQIEELENRQKRYNEARVVKERRATYERYLSDIKEYENKLAVYKEKYPAGLPDSQETEQIARAESEIAKNRVVLESSFTDAKRAQRLEELEKKFANPPQAEDIERAETAVRSYRENETQLKYRAPVQTAKRQSKGGIYTAVAVISAIILCAGAGLCFVLVPLAIALCIAGGLGIFVSAFLYLKKRTEGGAQDGLADIRARLYDDERKIRAVLMPYGYMSDNPATDFEMLKAELAELESLRAEFGNISLERSDLEERNGKLLEEIKGIFAKYSLTYGGDAGKTLEADGREIDFLNKQIAGLKTQAEEYKANNSLEEIPQENLENVDEELYGRRRELGFADKRIADDEEEVAKLSEWRRTLEKLDGEIEESTQKLRIYSGVSRFLTRAQSRLKDKYISPVKEKFLKYSDRISAISGYSIVLDENFDVSFESFGALHGFRHFSAGQRAVCSLCLRLALIDCLYPEEKPFLVLDDPFTALDKQNMSGVAKVVKELSKNNQIIYFCCHESREI